jgi:hypothetical protein
MDKKKKPSGLDKANQIAIIVSAGHGKKDKEKEDMEEEGGEECCPMCGKVKDE